MRHWNGWGSDEIEMAVSPKALDFLADHLGPPLATRTASFAEVVACVPASRLPQHPGVSTDPALRLRHARGQSLPDWAALRFGAVDCFPDGVAFPTSEEEVAEIIGFGVRTGARLIPYGGGTSVVGHINPQPGEAPVLTIDMGRMARLQAMDTRSRLATFGAGVTGPHLEAQLRAQDFTLGHYPQSFEFSTLGGWVASRSSGQQSLHYGRIEDLFAGGMLVAPAGRLELPPLPASAAGPDLRQLVLGSEGRMGILTRIVVRVQPLPDTERFYAVFFPDWAQGVEAVRRIVQAQAPVSMLRLGDETETTTTLVLAGHEHLIGAAERLLRRRGVGSGKCMLLFGVTGSATSTRQGRSDVLALAAEEHGVYLGHIMGSEWRRGRFRTPYLRNTLWELGYAVDTLETALPWTHVTGAHAAILHALRTTLDDEGERVHAFAHLSHLYPTGASIYATYLFRIAGSARETVRRWQRLKEAASRAIVDQGGTISHQHGVGIDHLPYLGAEKGELGLQALRDVFATFDPTGVMNPGKLVDSRS